MATSYPEGNFHSRNIRTFIEDVERSTDGRVGWSAMTLRGRPSHGDGILRNRHYIVELVWNRRHRVVDPMSGEAHRRLRLIRWS